MGGVDFMIELRNLTVGYKGRALTAPIDGRFDRGSLTAVMGANGSGKSTLLRTICGLQAPLSGQVIFNDQCANEVAWLAQQADVDRNFPMCVFDVVAMGCWPRAGIGHSLSPSELNRIEQALAQTGITSLVSQSIRTLSGGQFQRMLFARMLVQDSPIMLMDEPFVGIDAKTRTSLLRLISDLHEQGRTIIVVLHEQDVAEETFPETLLIHDGDVEWGCTRDVLCRGEFYQRNTPRPQLYL